MDSRKMIYVILKKLDTEKGTTETMLQLIGPDAIGCPEEKWAELMQCLMEEGLIRGLKIKKYIYGDVDYDVEDVAITMKGYEYLSENAGYRKFLRLFSDVVTISKSIPK